MARGWESKTVEAQIETAREDAARSRGPAPTREEAEILRKKEGLLLSRTRVLQDLANARNERYRTILRDALSQLEQDLEALDNPQR